MVKRQFTASFFVVCSLGIAVSAAEADVVRELRKDGGRVLDSRGRLWSRAWRVQFAL